MTESPDEHEPTLHELVGWAAPNPDAPPGAARQASEAARPQPTSQDRPAAGRSRSATRSAPTARGAGAESGLEAEPSAGADEAGAPRASRRSRGAASRGRIAIIDGSNVAHAGEGHAARLANVLAVREKLVEEGFEPVVVVDAALRHQIDDVERYERLVDEGAVKQAPAGTDADYFILSFAKELGAAVVSNDQFRDRGRQFADVRRRVIRYMIVAGEVVLERRTSRRKR
jgi:hypothetical protein